jgi:hypothetical protein
MTDDFGYKLLKIDYNTRHEAFSFQYLIVYTIFRKSSQRLSMLIFTYIPARRLAEAGLYQNLVQVAIRSVNTMKEEQSS